MEMHQVRYFLALCEERNFTRAELAPVSLDTILSNETEKE